MFQKYISSYIKKMTKEDIKDFSLKSNIILSDEEINTIYLFIKDKWKNILYSDHLKILPIIKDKISYSNYKKIDELIIFYKNKYKDYL